MPNYVTSVGMEVHAELSTKSKMFCRCQVAFGGEPNTRTCPVCLALPGSLPVPNREAIEMVIKTALALNCKIGGTKEESIFHRKNYFYPDIPKGYQTTQYGEENPFGYHGYLEIPTPDGGTKRIGIRRIHLEEDTGKLMHLPSGGSGIDYNRAGTPLMEIVTDFPPDIHNGEEAKEYLSQLRQILMYLGVCDGKMEEGSLRCEPNISIRPEGTEEHGVKSELKNLNSFRSVQMGIAFESRRQEAAIENGETLLQETRGWNEQKENSFAMRIKEAENDYRYFPCPDLVPMSFTPEYIAELKANLPELPLAKFQRYTQKYRLSAYDANLIISDRDWAHWFEEAMSKDTRKPTNLEMAAVYLNLQVEFHGRRQVPRDWIRDDQWATLQTVAQVFARLAISLRAELSDLLFSDPESNIFHWIEEATGRIQTQLDQELGDIGIRPARVQHVPHSRPTKKLRLISKSELPLRRWVLRSMGHQFLRLRSKAICNWMNSDFAKMLNEEGITARQSKITPAHLVELVRLIEDGTISGKIAKTIFAEAYASGELPKKLVESSGATQITDTGAIRAQVQGVLDTNRDVVAKYKSGNLGVKGFLVGQIMKATQGRANPGIVQQLLDELLSS